MDGSVCIVSTIITCPLLMDNMDYRTRFYGDTRTRIYPAQTHEFTPYVRRNLTFTHREHGETMNVSSPWPPFCLRRAGLISSSKEAVSYEPMLSAGQRNLEYPFILLHRTRDTDH